MDKVREHDEWVFFSSVKEGLAGGLVTYYLCDEDDTIMSLSVDLARVCDTFYSK